MNQLYRESKKKKKKILEEPEQTGIQNNLYKVRKQLREPAQSQIIPVSVLGVFPCFFNKGPESTLEGVPKKRGESTFLLCNPQTIWSEKYVKLNKSTSGRNPWR